MRSASMGRKFIPNWKRANFPISTRFSRRSKGSCDGGRPGSCALRSLGRIQGKTSNIQHPTSNTQRNGMVRRRCRFAALESWVLDVRCSMFCSYPLGRVMGAWWPSRSSKPPLARFTGRGVFDSLPLRQSQGEGRMKNAEGESGVTQISFPDFCIPGKGVMLHVARTNS